MRVGCVLYGVLTGVGLYDVEDGLVVWCRGEWNKVLHVIGIMWLQWLTLDFIKLRLRIPCLNKW